MGQVLCGWCGHPIHSLSHYYHEQKRHDTQHTQTRMSLFLFLCAVKVWLRCVLLPKIHTFFQKCINSLTIHVKIYWPVYAFEGLFSVFWANLLVLGIITGVI
jgi:hypothetical protein